MILSVFIINTLKIRSIQIGRGGLGLSDTAILKGIAIMMVVIGHIGQAIPGLRIFTPLGAMGVGVFLLCSGYGIEKSFEKNKRQKYWYKRIVNVWLPYAIIELLALPIHLEMGWQAILKDFTLIQPLHPFGWYMRFLFVWYILYYVFSWAGKYKLLLLNLSAFIVYVAFDSLHAQNAFSFAIGVAMAQITTIDNLWKKRYIWIGLAMSVLLFFTRDYVKINYQNMHLLWNTVSLLYYAALIMTVVIGYKTLSNKGVNLPYIGLAIIGEFSYELYLIHGYAYQVLIAPASIMMVTKFVLICIVGTYLLHKLNHFIIDIINKQNS